MIKLVSNEGFYVDGDLVIKEDETNFAAFALEVNNWYINNKIDKIFIILIIILYSLFDI